MSFGGGGNVGQDSTYRWNPSIESQWAADDGSGILSQARWLSEKPYQSYGNGNPNSRIAPLQEYQNDALAGLGAFGQNYIGNNGSQQSNNARKQIDATLTGQFAPGELNGDQFAIRNQYAGNNPYFRGVMQQGMGDITDAYKQGTSADTTRMFNLSGAFGGSAHQNAVANNENALGKQLSQYAQGMQNTQMDRTAGLEDSYLNRGSSSFNQERNRQQGAVGQAFGADDAYTRAMQSLMGAGDAQRQYNQQLLDYGFNEWNQEQEYPWQQLLRRAGIVSQAQGGLNPNAQISSNQGYSVSPLAGLLGAGALYGAFNGTGK